MFGFPNPWMLGGAVGLGAVLIVGSFVTGMRFEAKSGRIEELRSELAITQADLKNSQLAEDNALAQALELEGETKAQQERIDALVSEAAADPGTPRASGADLDRLYGKPKR